MKSVHTSSRRGYAATTPSSTVRPRSADPSSYSSSPKRTVAPTPLISTALGEPLSIGDGARGSLDAELLKHVCPFNISPAEGHLPAGEAATFEVTFSPLAPTLFGGAAILRPVGVPEAALPGYADDPAEVSDEGDRQLEIGLRLLGRGEGDHALREGRGDRAQVRERERWRLPQQGSGARIRLYV